ncbi:phosphatase PAP2 family protein [Eudoraea chungangensis]|uniref:phosphatase PAP2 family protein n=1 Tax=Eudoraea chungangensis TaxID=1481905 RepID=UPI0023EDF3E8|nr:phosphatase PAP2 family protein [Eudoraea chungangensis]
MKTPTLLLLLFVVFAGKVSSQEIHELEAVSAHYKKLQKLNKEANPMYSNLDAISFPMDGSMPGRQYIGIEPSYLTKEQVATLKTSFEFPANSSEQTRAELTYLLKLEKERTTASEARVLQLAKIGYWPPLEKNTNDLGQNADHLFWEYEEVTNKEAALDNYPNTLKLLAGVTRDMRIMEFTVKYHLLRARPYLLEPKLHNMQQMGSPSFASGHTLWAYIQAFVWSELLPEKRSEFLAVAFEVGHSREIMGIHYPSDEEAARVLAHTMLVKMTDNPEFKKDLEKAKAEWN